VQGLGSPIVYVPLEIIDSGTVAANDSVGDSTPTVASQYYSVEGNGAVWWNGVENKTGVTFTSSIVASENIGGAGKRWFALAAGGSLNITVDDNIFGDNTGSSGWYVRNARADGRRITLGAATIQNICPISEP